MPLSIFDPYCASKTDAVPATYEKNVPLKEYMVNAVNKGVIRDCKKLGTKEEFYWTP